MSQGLDWGNGISQGVNVNAPTYIESEYVYMGVSIGIVRAQRKASGVENASEEDRDGSTP